MSAANQEAGTILQYVFYQSNTLKIILPGTGMVLILPTAIVAKPEL